MSKLSEKFNNSLKLKANLGFYLIINENQITNKVSLFVHDSNQLPSFPTSKLYSISLVGLQMHSIKIFYEKKSFKLLPAPYETDCYDYIGSIKSQAQCLNDLLMREFLQNKCLPKNDDLLTFVVNNKNYSEFEYRFCENNKFKIRNKSVILGLNKCRKACNEELYEIWYSMNGFGGISLETTNLNYIVVEHKPAMEFNQYLVNFGGLLGLWYGLSLLDLKTSIIKFMEKIYLFKYELRIYSKYLLIFPKKIRTYLKLQVYY